MVGGFPTTEEDHGRLGQDTGRPQAAGGLVHRRPVLRPDTHGGGHTTQGHEEVVLTQVAQVETLGRVHAPGDSAAHGCLRVEEEKTRYALGRRGAQCVRGPRCRKQRGHDRSPEARTKPPGPRGDWVGARGWRNPVRVGGKGRRRHTSVGCRCTEKVEVKTCH